VTAAASNRLPVLQEEIRAAHRDARDAVKTAVDRARDAGLRLIEAKSLLGHGEWLPWLSETGVSPRTAQRYMRIARLPADKYDTVSHFGLKVALDEIAEKIEPPMIPLLRKAVAAYIELLPLFNQIASISTAHDAEALLLRIIEVSDTVIKSRDAGIAAFWAWFEDSEQDEEAPEGVDLAERLKASSARVVAWSKKASWCEVAEQLCCDIVTRAEALYPDAIEPLKRFYDGGEA
jgi:hypothetical protein